MRPQCVILAGPNGAGKSTHAHAMVARLHQIDRFINPDTIAAGIGAASANEIEFASGRIALRSISECIAQRCDFAFETTLSGRRWPILLDSLRAPGYDCVLHYLWIPDVALCVERVRRRVLAGGHQVHERDIRRRHTSSLLNLRSYFLPFVTEWHIYDASKNVGLCNVASGGATLPTVIRDSAGWRQIVDAPQARHVRERTEQRYHVSSEENPPMTASSDNDSVTPNPNDAPRRRPNPTAEDVVAASRIAVRRALSIHRALGISAAVMRDGKVMIIPPHELPLEANDPETIDPDEPVRGADDASMER